MRLLSFSLSAELRDVLAGAGEGVPDKDSSWLVVFDVFELSEPAPAALLNVTMSRTPSTASISSEPPLCFQFQSLRSLYLSTKYFTFLLHFSTSLTSTFARLCSPAFRGMKPINSPDTALHIF